MLKFAFGLTSGIVVGIAGSAFAAAVALIALEDSPEARKMFTELWKDK